MLSSAEFLTNQSQEKCKQNRFEVWKIAKDVDFDGTFFRLKENG